MTSHRFPIEIKELDKEALASYRSDPRFDYVTVGPKQYFLPLDFKHYAADVYNMEIRTTDVFVNTFLRSGTHVTNELVWLVANDLDYATAKSTPLPERFPMFLFSTHFKKEVQEECIKSFGNDILKIKQYQKIVTNSFSEVNSLPSPRFIHSHLPMSLMPPTYLDTARVVYVMRDVRDVAISYYLLVYGNKGILEYPEDFKTSWNNFMGGFVPYGPYFEHVKEFWEKRNHPHLLFIFYEDLVKDMPSVINRVAAFLNKKLTEEQITKLCQHLDIDNFRKNPSCNDDFLKNLGIFGADVPFIRKGKVGGWREYFDEEMSSQAQRWIADNLPDGELRDRYLHP